MDSQEVLTSKLGGDPVAKMAGLITIGAVLVLVALKKLSISASL